MIDCSSNPCLNGATCVVGSISVSCLCQSNFTGEFCENENSVPPCSNGGFLSNQGLLIKYFAIQSSSDFSDESFFSSTPVTQASGNVAIYPDTILPSGINPTSFGISWEGAIKVEQTGLYTFIITSTDYIRVFLNDVLLLDSWGSSVFFFFFFFFFFFRDI